jgi:hypothetical protein
MSQATEMRDAYVAAELAVLQGQSFRFGERMLTRADLVEIRNGRREWEARVSAEATVAAGGSPGIALANFRCGR